MLVSVHYLYARPVSKSVVLQIHQEDVFVYINMQRGEHAQKLTEEPWTMIQNQNNQITSMWYLQSKITNAWPLIKVFLLGLWSEWVLHF